MRTRFTHALRAYAARPKKQFYAKLLCLAVAVLSIVLDILTKQAVVHNMALYEEIPVLGGVLHWKYIQNRGAAFGMLADQRAVFLIISTVAIIGLFIYLIVSHSERMWWMAAIGMLVGGGIGNMIDRIALGYVIDFIYVALIDFAVFNIADCFVCVGVGLLIYLTLRDMIKEMKAEKKAKKESGDGGNE